MKAIVTRSSKRTFECLVPTTRETLNATALAKNIKGREKHIVVGDFVSIERQEEGDIITEVLPRKNEIFRQSPRERKKKIIASNIDVLVIVQACSKPEFKRGLLDRYLVRAVQWDIPALVVFNKADEFAEQFDIDFEWKRVQKVASAAFATVAINRPLNRPLLEHDLNDLKKELNGKTAIFLGQSGVGKSRLISALSDGKVDLESRELAKVGKGSHTTTWAEYIPCGHFNLIDSPGIRSFSLEDINVDELSYYFPDLSPHFEHCQFHDCAHQHNSKGCSFTQLDPNKLEDSFILSRLESYLRFREESQKTPEWKKR